MSEDRSTAPWDAWRAAEAEVVALRAQVEELTRERDMLAKGIKAQDGELLRRVRQAEARLAAVVQWLNVVLDETDYTAKACAPTEMVGAVLSREVIQSARAALAAAREQPTQEKLPLGHPFKQGALSLGSTFCYAPKQGDYCGQPESAHLPPTQPKLAVTTPHEPDCQHQPTQEQLPLGHRVLSHAEASEVRAEPDCEAKHLCHVPGCDQTREAHQPTQEKP